MLAPNNAPRYRFTLFSDILGTRRLRHDPIGWDTLSTTLRRDLTRHGVAVDFTSDLSFVKDGRAYLLRAYRAAGAEADVQVLIEQLVPNEFRWLPYYRGRVNFLAAEIGPTQFKVNLESVGWLQKFLSRDSVQVDLFGSESVSGAAGPAAAPRTVELHSRAILQRYAASQKEDGPLASGFMYGDHDDPSHEQVLYFGFNTRELNELELGAVGGGFVDGSVADVVPIYTSASNGEFTIEFDISAHVEAHAQGPAFRKVDAVFHFRVGNAAPILLAPEIHVAGLDGDYVGDIASGPRSFVVQLQAGDSIYLYADYYVHEVVASPLPYQATISAKIRNASYLRITAKTTTEPTTTTGLLLYEAFERLCQALTDEVDVFRSDFLGRPDCSVPYAADGAGALTLLTGGFQVRGFPPLSDPAPTAGKSDPRKTLYATWQNLFNSCAAAYGLGWGLEWAVGRSGRSVQVIRVEPWSYWYGADVVLDLTAAGPVGETIKIDEARHYQVVEVGYDHWQAQQANGLDEYNSKRQLTTPLTVSHNAYTQISRYSASGILLETTRRDRYDATATTDTNQDATNFLVCLLRTGTGLVTERNQQATRLDGVLSPATVYNLRLSPARMLRRHGALLRAALVPTAGALVRFTAGEGNTTMVSQLVGEAAAVGEGTDLPVAELEVPKWLPEQVSFTVPVSQAQLPTVLARPNGRVRYRGFEGPAREGWLLEFKHDPYTRQATLTLLPCAS